MRIPKTKGECRCTPSTLLTQAKSGPCFESLSPFQEWCNQDQPVEEHPRDEPAPSTTFSATIPKWTLAMTKTIVARPSKPMSFRNMVNPRIRTNSPIAATTDVIKNSEPMGSNMPVYSSLVQALLDSLQPYVLRMKVLKLRSLPSSDQRIPRPIGHREVLQRFLTKPICKKSTVTSKTRSMQAMVCATRMCSYGR